MSGSRGTSSPPLGGGWPAGQRGCGRYLQGIVICGGTPMARMTMIEAIRSAIDVSMGRDEDVVVFGEDVGYFGGVFRCTQGLQQKYGKTRCFDTPISESGIVGAAIGMAAYGLKPCVEIQFAEDRKSTRLNSSH